jgi:hypothetical protein
MFARFLFTVIFSDGRTGARPAWGMEHFRVSLAERKYRENRH